MPSFADMSDSQLVAWMDNFFNVTTDSPADFGVTAAQVTAVKVKADELREKMAARQTADDAAKAATTAQRISRGAAEPDVSYLNTIIKANPNVSDANKEAAGIDLRKPARRTAPTRPDNLVANGFQDGRNTLKWDRAGNKTGAQFIVESKTDGETEFKFLAATTEAKYEQLGATPGKRCTYRVKAQRSGEESTYSNEATVY